MFKHNQMFTDTCDCCGKTFEPWQLTHNDDGDWVCPVCYNDLDGDYSDGNDEG
jgi:hypothetical protein